MFEVGFSELIMVGLVALLVIGPEKLPKAARIAGFWLGKTRSTIAAFKAEIKQELHAEEMRQLVRQQFPVDELQETIHDVETAASEINSALTALSETKIDIHDDKPA